MSDPTDDLTAAVTAWVTSKVLLLDNEHLQVLQACTEANGADLRVVIAFREGTISFEATLLGKCLALAREHVTPLQPVVLQ
jgi:hypothetical protein